jgi:hypothetical protein
MAQICLVQNVWNRPASSSSMLESIGDFRGFFVCVLRGYLMAIFEVTSSMLSKQDRRLRKKE